MMRDAYISSPATLFLLLSSAPHTHTHVAITTTTPLSYHTAKVTNFTDKVH